MGYKVVWALRRKPEVESQFLAELAYTHPEILGAVGWTDLHGPHIEENTGTSGIYTFKGFNILLLPARRHRLV